MIQPMKALTDFAPGSDVVVQAIQSGIPDDERSHLLAWGIAPGTELRLITHQPVTRLLIEHTELAIERSVAVHIRARAAE